MTFWHLNTIRLDYLYYTCSVNLYAVKKDQRFRKGLGSVRMKVDTGFAPEALKNLIKGDDL